MEAPVTLENLQGELKRFAQGALREELSEILRRLDTSASASQPLARLTEWAKACDTCNDMTHSDSLKVRNRQSVLGLKRYGNDQTRQELMRLSTLRAAKANRTAAAEKVPHIYLSEASQESQPGPTLSRSPSAADVSQACAHSAPLLLDTERSDRSDSPLVTAPGVASNLVAHSNDMGSRGLRPESAGEEFEGAAIRQGRVKIATNSNDSAEADGAESESSHESGESVSLLDAAAEDEQEGQAANASRPSTASAQEVARKTADEIGNMDLREHRSWRSVGGQSATSVLARRRGLTGSFDGQESRLTALVSSAFFEQFTGMLVVLNALVLGWEAHYESMHPDSKLPLAAHHAETVFCLIFVVELLLRIQVMRGNFINAENCCWNMFDSLMVLFMVVDQMAEIFKELQLPVNLSVVRMLRLLRLIRITRLIRVLHLFDELRTIVTSMSRSGGSLGWALLMVLMMIYVFSVLFLQVIADSGKLPGHPSLHHWFGGLWRTALTMFECIVGGVSWDEVIVPLMEDVSPVMGLLFCSYVTVAVFAMMNLVTGVFVENVAKTVREDKDILLALRITELFLGGDGLGPGQEITWDAFAEKMQSSVMQDLFKAMDVNPSEARHLFDLLDVDGSGSVDADEIVNGCLTLRGPAKSLDISILLRAVAAVQDSVDWQFNSLRDSLRPTFDEREPDKDMAENLVAVRPTSRSPRMAVVGTAC